MLSNFNFLVHFDNIDNANFQTLQTSITNANAKVAFKVASSKGCHNAAENNWKEKGKF